MITQKQRKYLKIFWILVLSPFVLITLLILGISWFADMPSLEELENPQSNLAAEIYSSDQELLGKYFYENRSSILYKDLSSNVVNALKATEDIRFEEHSGVDIIGLVRVMFKTVFLRQSSSGGGSTITQQLAKNLFPRENMSKMGIVLRKVKEWIIAVKLERNYTKAEIMALYLNTVEFGSNAFGVKSAARVFFGKTPDKLSVNEAAMLVGLLKAPSYYSPVRNPKSALIRRNVVLGQMYKYDLLTQDEYDSLKVLPIKLQYIPEDHNTGLATYFREYLRVELLKWCEDHKKSDGTPYNLYTDGLKIYTTINATMQRYAEEAVQEHLTVLQQQFYKHWKGRGDAWKYAPQVIKEGMHRSDRYINMKRNGANDKEIKVAFETKIKMMVFSWHGEIDTVMSPLDSIKYYKLFMQTGFMSMEPQTGYIRAWVGGINYKYFKYDHVKEGRRQVGSTFKPFVYTVAMQNGYSPCFQVKNDPVTFLIEGQPSYTPENAEPDDDGKVLNLKEALANSVNRISAYLIKQFGPQAVVDVARKMGITSPMDVVPSLCLGTPDISVYEMVGAYSVFANNGMWTEPTYITRIEDKNGNVLEERVPTQKQAISEETSYLMLSLLKGVTVHKGTAAGLRFRYKLNQPMGGKTGTTQNHSDGWYMGLTPDLVSGCWVGAEDRAVHFRSLELGQGARMALPIWALYMQKVYADKSLKVSQGDFDSPGVPITVETDCDTYVQDTPGNMNGN